MSRVRKQANRLLTRKEREGLRRIMQSVEKIRFNAINQIVDADHAGKDKTHMSIETALPEGCELRNFDGDLQLIGIGMTEEKYQGIKKGLPAEIQDRLIGWKRIGR